jgi:hypothetical protein
VTFTFLPLARVAFFNIARPSKKEISPRQRNYNRLWARPGKDRVEKLAAYTA